MKATVTGMYKFDGKAGMVGFFDVQLEDFLILKGCTLRLSKANKYYWKPPAKPRIKNGETMTDEQGRQIYDDHYRLLTVGKGEERKLTPGAAKFNEDVTAQAVTAYEQLDSGRGAPAKATAAVGAKKTDDVEDDDGSLPF